MRMFVVGIAFAAGATLLAPGPAWAQVTAEALAASDVVVDPGADLSAGERDRLQTAAEDLRQQGTPTKFVVVARRPVNPPEFAAQLRRSIGFHGNVLVLSQSPRSLGIGSALPGSVVQDAFEASVDRLRADPVDGIIVVAQRLRRAEAGGAPASPGAEGPSRERPQGISGLLLLGLLFAGGLALFAFTRRTTRRQAEETAAEERAAVEPLVDALAVQVSELDSDVRLGGERADEARAHVDEAILAYGEVRDAMAGSDIDSRLSSIRLTLERGLRAAQAARAILDGRPPPDPAEAPLLEGLCTFDPKHGRAVRKVRLVTPAGDEATLPVCRNCAEGLEAGTIPDIRQVPRHRQAVPYWEGAGALGFGGGWFPLFGGMMGGMMLHDFLSPGVTVMADGDGIGGFGGGGVGGGDFGGGDFGGGGDF